MSDMDVHQSPSHLDAYGRKRILQVLLTLAIAVILVFFGCRAAYLPLGLGLPGCGSCEPDFWGSLCSQL